MAYKYRWLAEALDDMSNEIDYVAKEFGLRAAKRVESRVHERVLQLCKFPNRECVTRKMCFITAMK